MEKQLKNILGLDLGTNSIGWSLVNLEEKKIVGMGSRIIPMTQDVIDNFGSGKPSTTQTAERTSYRGVRRLRERHLLRRERLHRVLNVLNFLPEHYANQIDFEKKFGKFKEETEPKIAYFNGEFLFKKSFEEMLDDFKKHQPEILKDKNGNSKLIPYDWTIYYLRKKALTQKIEKEELAWLILNFNQKRGYYQLRGEEEEEVNNKLVEFHSLKVVDVIEDEETSKKGEKWYSLILENGWIYRRSSSTSLADWKGRTKEFIVTTELNDDGSIKVDKEGKERRSFRAPKEEDWGLVKKKTEHFIDNSKTTVGTFIYNELLKNPNQKIKGKLVRTIERKYYKEELDLILKKQIEFHADIFNKDKFNECIRELYKNNHAHQLNLQNRDFLHLFLNDIIFYQRPLKSQKSTISNCTLEYTTNQEGKKYYLKAIAKSNPYYQEFRVWQWLSNLKIYRIEDDCDVTSEFIKSKEDYVQLFDFLMSKKEVDHSDIIKHYFPELKGKQLATEIAKYRWNYVYDTDKKESKSYPMNETGYEIARRLSKVTNISNTLLTKELELKLWHIIYSVTDKKEFETALKSFAIKHQLDEVSFVENFKNYPPFKSEYGAYSEKAIKKLLPLMRLGKYWSWEGFDGKTKKRIDNLLTGEENEQIKLLVREKVASFNLTSEKDFQGLPLWLAQYVVYGRHSEAGDIGKWKSPSEMKRFIESFKQHDLRNPIVEQVVLETLRVVKDIWEHYGKGTENFFDEIHIELGRDLKKTTEERKRLTTIVTENEATNTRIKALLMEMLNDNSFENVRPYSPSQQEILKIYEEGVLQSNIEIEEEILKISKKAEPTKAELQRYKLWLEQKYRSPYTGQIIPLNKLFTHEYEIEHIIPQSRYFDDSFNNKVICESAVNKLKDNQLGYEFILNHFGQKVVLGNGKTVEILNEENYKNLIKDSFTKNVKKRTNLLLTEVPENMINRQLNDTRYIGKFISTALSNLVRSDEKDDGVNSKNIVSLNGVITTRLKQDWGLNDVWNDLILPRFERMNQLTQSELYTTYNEKHQKYLPTVPFEQSKGFQKKRIDHRHHAMDALVIACATRDHVNLLNNQSAKSENSRYDLQRKLRKTEKYVKDNIEKVAFKDFYKPWDTFTKDSKRALERIVVSFKQNMRVINKATNYYESYKDENGNLRLDKNGKPTKDVLKQQGVNWAIRKPLHKETVSGKVDLPWIKVPKDKVLTATRKSLDTSFTSKTIESITDRVIQKILNNYLKFHNNDPNLAFSPEGIEDMNKNISQFNEGKYHHPIYKVRVFELGSKFALGTSGNKKDKYVEAAKGTNLFFAIYEDENKKRNFATIPLNEVIERQKQGLSSVPETNEKGHALLFSLSPNDLVYVPEVDEDVNSIDFSNLTKEQAERVYKIVSFTSNRLYGIPSSVSSVIVNKLEYSQLNKIEFISEKQILRKITSNRIGLLHLI